MEHSDSKPSVMDRHLDVLRCREDGGGLLLGASCLTGRYWLGSLWFYQAPEHAPDVDKCTAGVQLEAGVSDAQWVDSTHVVVALDTGGIALWSLEDECRTFLLSQAALGHDDIATSVSVVCNKTKAVSCSFDRCIKEWDLSNMSILSSYTAHTDHVSCVDCHPSEAELFVSCAKDGKLLLWDKRKPKPASVLQTSPLQTCPTCVQWQPNEVHKMAVGSEGGQIALLDTRMGVENYLTSYPHSRSVTRLQFSPSQPSLLATVSEDGKAVVSTLEDDGIKQTYSDETHTDFVQGLSWSSSSSSPSDLFTCAWDSKVICHNVKAKMATIQGGCPSSSVPIHINGGDTGKGKNKEDMGDGDSEKVVVQGKKISASTNNSTSSSYSKVLQNGGGVNGQQMESE